MCKRTTLNSVKKHSSQNQDTEVKQFITKLGYSLINQVQTAPKNKGVGVSKPDKKMRMKQERSQTHCNRYCGCCDCCCWLWFR